MEKLSDPPCWLLSSELAGGAGLEGARALGTMMDSDSLLDSSTRFRCLRELEEDEE